MDTSEFIRIKFDGYKKAVDGLNRGFNELKNDPSCFIYEYFAKITRQVDIRGETLIDDINQN